MTTGTIIGTLIGCVIGNFIFRAVTDRNWSRATEWSFAQASVIAAVFINAYLAG